MRFFAVRAFCVRRRLIERHCERALSSKWRSKTVRSDPCRAKRAPESFRATPVERDAPQGHSERPLSSETTPPPSSTKRNASEGHSERPLSSETRSRVIPSDLCRAERAPGTFRATLVERNAPQGHSERPLRKIRSAEGSLVDTLSLLSGGAFFAFYRSFLALTDSRWGARGCKREGKWSAPVIPQRPRASLSVRERPCARFACVVG